MRALTNFVCIVLPMALLSSCRHSEEPDYPRIASAISNYVLVDVLDSESNSLVDNEVIVNGLSFVDKDGDKSPFNIVETGDGKLISTVFPLPMESSMSYSDNSRNDGYGESTLTVNVNGLKYELKGKFHYTCPYPGIYGGDSIKIIEIHCDDPDVSVNTSGETPRIAIKIVSD